MFEDSLYKELYTVLTLLYFLGIAIFFLAMIMIGPGKELKDYSAVYVIYVEALLESLIWPITILLYLTINLLATARKNLGE